MRRNWFLALITIVLWSCKDEDTGPDLSSATLSLVMDSPPEAATTYYAIVSDSSGVVLEWKELERDKQTDLPYPPDPKLAVLTIIRWSQNNRNVSVMSFAEVSAGTYTYSPDTDQLVLPDVEYKVNVDDIDTYYNVVAHVMPDALYKYEDLDDDVREYSLGLFNSNQQNDLLIMASKADDDRQYRHKYFSDIKGNESMTITAEDFPSFDVTPAHLINYPAHPDMLGTFMVLYGYNDGGGAWALDFKSWDEEDILKVAYPDMDNLFTEYETILASTATNGSVHITDIRSDEPVLDISIIDATIEKSDGISGKRIAIDMTSGGHVFYGESLGRSGVYSWAYNVFAPMSSKIRFNPPQFPSELSDKVPGLSDLLLADLGTISSDDYDMSYEQLYQFKLSKGYGAWPKYLVSTAFQVDDLGADRMSLDPKAILKRYGKESLLNNIK